MRQLSKYLLLFIQNSHIYFPRSRTNSTASFMLKVKWTEHILSHTIFFPPLVSEDILPQLHDKWLFMVLSHCREITWKKKKQGKKKIFFPDRRIPSGTSHGSLFQDEINM